MRIPWVGRGDHFALGCCGTEVYVEEAKDEAMTLISSIYRPDLGHRVVNGALLNNGPFIGQSMTYGR